MNRNAFLALALVVGGVLGAVLHAALRGTDSSPRDESVADAPRATPAPVDPPDRFEHMKARLEAIEAEVKLLREEGAARGGRWAKAHEDLLERLGKLGSLVATVAPGGAPEDDSPRAVETMRSKWRQTLDEMDRRLDALLKEGADPNEIVMWSRLDDVRRARIALEAATDMKALRLLAQGEWKSTFKFER